MFVRFERFWDVGELSENGLTSLRDTRVISLLSFNRYPRQSVPASPNQSQLSPTSTLAWFRVEEGPCTNYN